MEQQVSSEPPSTSPPQIVEDIDQGGSPPVINDDSLQAREEMSIEEEEVPNVMISEEDNERGIDQMIRVGQDKVFIQSKIGSSVLEEQKLERNIKGHEIIIKEYLELKLKSYGYEADLVQRLLAEYQQPYLNQVGLSLEEAVELLSKDQNRKWMHEHTGGSSCKICLEPPENHSETPYIIEDIQIRDVSQVDLTCGVCYNQVERYEELVLLKCNHVYCEECLREFITYQISVGKVQGGLCCPDQSCTENGPQISLALLQNHIMSPESFKKYKKFTNRLRIYRDPSLKSCPTVDCEGILQKPENQPPLQFDEQQPQALCPECKKLYCFKCLNLFHFGESCESKIDKGYQEWAEPNQSIVGECKNCHIRIEKEGGCPHMICQMCKHEWCWICKSDFPVHTSECPNYQTYLELLEFQGLDNFDGDEDINPGRWFSRTGSTGGLLFLLASTLFLVLVITPCIVIFNILITPVYIFSMLITSFNIPQRLFTRNFWMVFVTVIFFILFYSCIPITFLIVTVPQVFFHYAKKYYEVKDLVKSRCRRYRKLSVNPINNRLLRCIGLR